MKHKTVIFLGILTALAFISWCMFYTGMQYSRQQVRILAETMTKEPTNSFTACLTQMWEKSGELDSDWKGKRKWALITVEGTHK